MPVFRWEFIFGKKLQQLFEKARDFELFIRALDVFFAGIWTGACSWTSICAPAFSSSIWREKKCSISDWKWNIKKERIFECHPTQPENFPNLCRFWDFLSPKKRHKFGTWLYFEFIRRVYLWKCKLPVGRWQLVAYVVGLFGRELIDIDALTVMAS